MALSGRRVQGKGVVAPSCQGQGLRNTENVGRLPRAGLKRYGCSRGLWALLTHDHMWCKSIAGWKRLKVVPCKPRMVAVGLLHLAHVISFSIPFFSPPFPMRVTVTDESVLKEKPPRGMANPLEPSVTQTSCGGVHAIGPPSLP